MKIHRKHPLKDVQFYDIYRTYRALKGRAHKFQFQILSYESMTETMG